MGAAVGLRFDEQGDEVGARTVGDECFLPIDDEVVPIGACHGTDGGHIGARPLSAGFRNSSICAGVPRSAITGVAMSLCTRRPMETPAEPPRGSSSALTTENQ